jgi:hypothetical protein
VKTTLAISAHSSKDTAFPFSLVDLLSTAPGRRFSIDADGRVKARRVKAEVLLFHATAIAALDENPRFSSKAILPGMQATVV